MNIVASYTAYGEARGSVDQLIVAGLHVEHIDRPLQGDVITICGMATQTGYARVPAARLS